MSCPTPELPVSGAAPAQKRTPTMSSSEIEHAKTAKARKPEIRPIQHDSGAGALVQGGGTTTPDIARDDRGLNMARPINVEAILEYSRGGIGKVEFASGADEKSSFRDYVIVDDMFAGSDTNCHYNSKCKYCSFVSESEASERSVTIASPSVGPAKLANIRKRVSKRKITSTKEKWIKLLKAFKAVAEAMQEIMEDMED